MSKTHTGFQVRQHNPLRLWAGLGILLLLLVIMFLLGRAYQAYELSQIKIIRQTLEDRVADLELRNESLVRKNAQLDSDSKIERDAYEFG